MIKLRALKQAHKIEKYLSGRVASPIKVLGMFCNCPVRKLASHSPPSCEKNHTHKHTHLQAQTHAPWHPCSLTAMLPGTRTPWHTHMDTDRLRHKAPTNSCWYHVLSSQEGVGLSGRGPRCLSAPASVCRDLHMHPGHTAFSPAVCSDVATASALGRHSFHVFLSFLCLWRASWYPISPGEPSQGPGI